MKTKIAVSTEYDELIWPIMTTFQLIACWPNRDELKGVRNIKIVLRLFNRYLALISVIILMIGVVLDVVIFWGEDMNRTVESCLVGSAAFLAILRIIMFNMRQNDMLLVIETMREDWMASSIEERSLLRSKCLFSFKLAKFFISTVVIGAGTFIIMPIIQMISSEEASRELAFRGYFYSNQTKTPVFQYLYVLNAIVGIVASSTIAAAASFSLISSIHGAAKFAIVQQDFQSISSSSWVMSKKLTKCVQRHQESIRFAETLEKIITYLALMQSVMSSGHLCFAAFLITTMVNDTKSLLKYCIFIPPAIVTLFIYSYSGQCLKNESENVAEYVYSSNWFGIFSPNSIQLILMRSQKPCTITARKFYDMSFQSFLKVLSTSFSYFTVLLAMENK